jgi:hypothetical protein
MRPVVAFVGIALAATLTACGSGSSDSPKAASSPSTKPSITTAQPTQSPTAQATPTLAGIVLASCLPAESMKELDFVDPVSNQVDTRYFVASGYETQADCGTTEAYRLARRSAFNSTFTLLAANQATSNNGYHAGVLHASKSMQDMTPDFTDLSATTNDDFGAAIQQTAGAFGPNGKLYFVQITPGGSPNPDKVQLMAVDPNGGTPQEVPASDDIKNVRIEKNPTGPSNYGVYFVPGYDKPLFRYDTALAVSPDGSWAFWRDSSTNNIRYGAPDTPGTKLEINDKAPAVDPMIYVDKTSYIGADGNSLVLTKITGNSTSNVQLLPPTDGSILYPTLSPDRTKVAFILKKDTTVALYTVSIAGGQPTKVKDLDRTSNAQVILDWIS